MKGFRICDFEFRISFPRWDPAEEKKSEIRNRKAEIDKVTLWKH